MSNKPKVVVVSGPTCTGKSTLAHAIANELSATLLSQDEVLSEMIPDSDRNLFHRRLSYDELFKRAKIAYGGGEDLVLEGTFSRLEYRKGLIFAFPDAHVLVFELSVPPEVALSRFRQRGEHPAIDQTEEIVCARNIDFPFSNTAVKLNGRLSKSDLLSVAIDKINAGVTTDTGAWKSASIEGSPFERSFQPGFQRS